MKTEAEEGNEIKVSGWYTDIDWTLDNGHKEGSGNSFLFVVNDEKKLVKLKCNNTDFEVYHAEDLLCGFGE